MTIDLTGVADSSGFDALPVGEYTVVIENAEQKTSKAGAPMVEVIYSITEPHYQNRKIYDYFVLNNDTGLQRLKRMCKQLYPALPRPDFLTSVNEVIDKHLTLKLDVTFDARYGEQNKVKDYKPVPTNTAPGTPPQQATDTTGPAPAGKAPWE